MNQKSIIAPHGDIRVLRNVHTMNILVYAMDIFEKLQKKASKHRKLRQYTIKDKR